MSFIIKAVTADLVDDLAKLFDTEQITHDCWCMWFIIPVKAFHAAGSDGNRASFCDLIARGEFPPGLLAYRDGEPVGWCAVSPRERYIRALKTPTYRESASDGETGVWFVPCFFVHRDARGEGVGRALLEAAVTHAREHGAAAIEGFPISGTKRRTGGDTQVGHEPLFASCGFEVIHTPSPSRVVMRLELSRPG